LPVAYHDGHAAIHAGEKIQVAAVEGPSVTSIHQIQAVHLMTLRRRDQDVPPGNHGTRIRPPRLASQPWYLVLLSPKQRHGLVDIVWF
jgi:hypothetical protein